MNLAVIEKKSFRSITIHFVWAMKRGGGGGGGSEKNLVAKLLISLNCVYVFGAQGAVKIFDFRIRPKFCPHKNIFVLYN